MNIMNKNVYIPFTLLVISAFLFSCGDDDPVKSYSIDGVWYTTERTLSTGNKEVDDRVNSLLRLDIKEYKTRREFKRIESNIEEGSVETTAKLISSPEGPNMKDRKGTYKVEKDWIYITEDKLGYYESRFYVGETILTTETKITKDFLEELVIEVGGASGMIPEGITGTLKTTEAR